MPKACHVNFGNKFNKISLEIGIAKFTPPHVCICHSNAGVSNVDLSLKKHSHQGNREVVNFLFSSAFIALQCQNFKLKYPIPPPPLQKLKMAPLHTNAFSHSLLLSLFTQIYAHTIFLKIYLHTLTDMLDLLCQVS